MLNTLLNELRLRPRVEGIETVLVTSKGKPWTGGGFGGSFNRIRDAAGIVHIDEETGQRKNKHLHDLRGTFCSKLILAASVAGQSLTDQEVTDLMGWSPEQVPASAVPTLTAPAPLWQSASEFGTHCKTHCKMFSKV